MARHIHLKFHLGLDELAGRCRNTVMVNRHFATIEELEDAQAERCVALQAHRELIRSTTLFRRWPLCIKKRQGPRRNK